MKLKQIDNNHKETFLGAHLLRLASEHNSGAVIYTEDMIDFSNATDKIKKEVIWIVSQWQLQKPDGFPNGLISYSQDMSPRSTDPNITRLLAMRAPDRLNWDVCVTYHNKTSFIDGHWPVSKMISATAANYTFHCFAQNLEFGNDEHKLCVDMLESCHSKAKAMGYYSGQPNRKDMEKVTFSFKTDHGEYELSFNQLILTNEFDKTRSLSRYLFSIALDKVVLSFTKNGSDSKDLVVEINRTFHGHGSYNSKMIASATGSVITFATMLRHALAIMHRNDDDNITGMLSDSDIASFSK